MAYINTFEVHVDYANESAELTKHESEYKMSPLAIKADKVSTTAAEHLTDPSPRVRFFMAVALLAKFANLCTGSEINDQRIVAMANGFQIYQVSDRTYYSNGGDYDGLLEDFGITIVSKKPL